jgi:hypothetical protein
VQGQASAFTAKRLVEKKQAKFQPLLTTSVLICLVQIGSVQVNSLLRSVSTVPNPRYGLRIPHDPLFTFSLQPVPFSGANAARGAQVASRIAFLFAVAIGIMWCVTIITFRGFIPRVFTTDPDVQALCSTMLIALGVCQLFNCPMSVLGGLLRGVGKPSTVVVSFYAVASGVLTSLLVF